MSIIIALYRVIAIGIISFSIADYAINFPSRLRSWPGLTAIDDYMRLFINIALPICGPLLIGFIIWYLAPVLSRKTVPKRSQYFDLSNISINDKALKDLLLMSVAVTAICFTIFYLANFFIALMIYILIEGLDGFKDADWIILLDSLSALSVGLCVLLFRDVFLSFWDKRKPKGVGGRRHL
jgi:hypothetical protein